MSVISGVWAAENSKDAMQDASAEASGTQRYIFNETMARLDPFYKAGVDAIPDIKAAAEGLPSYEDSVTKPMEGWDYKQSPSYDAKYTLGMEELNKQLQARGLTASGRGGTRAADLARRLTSEDYNSERSFKLGTLTEGYKGRMAENTARYNRLLDLVKGGQGAAGSMGNAGNQFATNVGENTMKAGEAEAGFYSGLGGLTGQTASTGLRAYDYGNKNGWWGGGASDDAVTKAGADAASRAYTAENVADAEMLKAL